MTTSVRSVADLTAVLARGERAKFLFFWGHQPEADGRIGAQPSARGASDGDGK